MALEMTLWTFDLLFSTTPWNAVTAYTIMGNVDLQGLCRKVGILEDGKKLAEGVCNNASGIG